MMNRDSFIGTNAISFLGCFDLFLSEIKVTTNISFFLAFRDYQIYYGANTTTSLIVICDSDISFSCKPGQFL